MGNDLGKLELNDEPGNKEENENIQAADDAAASPGKKKYHSSALYAASMWHGTVTHVKHPHTDGNFLPTQA